MFFFQIAVTKFALFSHATWVGLPVYSFASAGNCLDERVGFFKFESIRNGLLVFSHYERNSIPVSENKNRPTQYTHRTFLFAPKHLKLHAKTVY